MNILKYFSQEERDRREYREDNKRLATLTKMAEKAINVRYIDTSMWIVFDGVPVLRVTNEDDVTRRTISIQQVEPFIQQLRESYIATHKNDRLEVRA